MNKVIGKEKVLFRPRQEEKKRKKRWTFEGFGFKKSTVHPEEETPTFVPQVLRLRSKSVGSQKETNGGVFLRIGNYQIQNLIGSGTFSQVYRCYSPITDEYFAAKVLRKSKIKKNYRKSLFMNKEAVGRDSKIIDTEGLATIDNEIEIFKLLGVHENIVMLHEVISDSELDSVYLSKKF